jgi:hypothetical protein
MYDYSASAEFFGLESERNAPRTTVLSWIKQLLEARRRKLEIARDMAYLRSLDPHVLEDIGVKVSPTGRVEISAPQGVPKRFFDLPFTMNAQ